MKFKNKHSEKAFFTFDGNTRICIDGLYETEDKEEIKFLKDNSNFVEYKEVKKVIEEPVIVEQMIEEIEEIEEPVIVEEDE